MGEYVGIWRFRLRPDTDRDAFERLIGVVGRYFAQVPGVRQYTLHRKDPAHSAAVDDYVTLERWESPEVHTRSIQELMKRIGDQTPGESKDAYEAYTASREMCESARYESFLPVP